MNELYIDTEGKTFINVKDLLKFLYPLYEENGNKKIIITYKDKDCMEEHCSSYHRSYNEIWIICKTYFSNIKKKDFTDMIMRILSDTKDINLIFCPDVCKLVIHQSIWTYKKKGLFNDRIYDYKNYIVNGVAVRDTVDGVTLYDIIVKDWKLSEYDYIQEMNIFIQSYLIKKISEEDSNFIVSGLESL